MQKLSVLLLAWWLTLFAAPSQAEFFLGFYGGVSQVSSGDLLLFQPGGTRLRFDSPAWDSRDFEDPAYYGARGGYWFSRESGWGVLLDFTHSKAFLKPGQIVRVTGTKGGAPVDERIPIEDHLSQFSMSHGHNFLTLNGMYRWVLADKEQRFWLGRLKPYAGLGIGLTIPHVEALVDGVSTEESQVGGPAFQMLLGFQFDVIGPLAFFTEYKGTVAVESLDLVGGGKIDVTTWTNQLNFGGSIHF